MRASLEVADACGHDAILLIGDPAYYGRFGFTADATAGWAAPGPVERHRLLSRLAPGVQLPRRGQLQAITQVPGWMRLPLLIREAALAA